MITLASEETPIACAVAQVPNLGEGTADLPKGLLAQLENIAESRQTATVPAVTASADGVGVIFEDGAFDWFTRVATERAPNWRNEILVSGLSESPATGRSTTSAGPASRYF